MLTIRAMSDGTGYSARHLEHSDYYAEGERVTGQWQGRGAELLGLSGEVRSEQFEALRRGLDPQTGDYLRQRHSADRMAADGTIQSLGRNLYDFTVSAPKSVSIMAQLGGDMLKNPYDDELRQIVQQFGALLKQIVDTIDRHGLKKRFLNKYLCEVERFYKRLFTRQWQSEVAAKCKQRFDKNRKKLFTFLGYDGVPWNNNNAEHAMKAFAALRDVIEGTTTASGIEDYLVLLSVTETCRYKGLDVLEFFLSEEKDIDGFLRSRGRTRTQSGRSNEKPTQDRIVQTALEILATHPAGLGFSSLVRRLYELLPHESENTIRIYTWKLPAWRPQEVYKPARGIFRLARFRETEATDVETNRIAT